MPTLKSIGAIFAGFVTVALLSTLTDFILESVGVFTPPGEGFFVTWMLIVALSYRILYTVAGGYVTALTAPNRPMRHVVILGSIGTVLAIVGTIVGWDLSAHWYPIALVVTALPCTWFGGYLRLKRKPEKSTWGN